MTDDLWGELPEPPEIETPFDIFREQASLLGQKTNGKLIGEVVRAADEHESISLSFCVTAPSLNHYRYAVLQAYHSLTDIYPVTLLASEIQTKCGSPEDLRSALQTILRSKRVPNTIRGLLLQIP